MNSVSYGRGLAAPVLALALLLCLAAHGAEQKSIRLRNETINTETRAASGGVKPQALEGDWDGLYLLQLEKPIPADFAARLAVENAVLVRYVPDDAYIVRLKGANAARLKGLPFVRWVGPYRPEHKLFSSLRPAANGAPAPARRVTALLSPAASPVEIAWATRVLGRLERSSRSRFGMVIQGVANAAQLKTLSESHAVLWIEPASQPRLFDEVAAEITEGEHEGPTTEAQSLGFDGRGVVVAVADSGLNNGDFATMHPDLFGRVDAFLYYGALTDAADEHSHGTHVTGIIAGNGATGETDELGYLYGLGMAPKAHIVTQRIFDGLGGYEPPASNAQLTKDAVRSGAVIGSNSWGDDTQGRYDVSAMEFDALVRDADPDRAGDQPYILEFSAGNAGPAYNTIGSPAVAKNVIATGASQNNRPDFFLYAEGQDAMADFSSRGPCEDGRIKPDLVAPGTWIASLRSAQANDDNAWAPISDHYMYQGGTSQAGPQVSGAAAVFTQFYRETHAGRTPSPALVKAALINSAVDMDDASGTEPTPNNDEGWGRLDLTGLLGSPRSYDYLDQTELLAEGQVYERHVFITDSSQPLKVTLVYTDVPGLPSAIPALVNDLDLEVAAPNGDLYRGNQFLDGESVPFAPSADMVNNVEGIRLGAPNPGEYIVRVRARRVAEDARRDTPKVDQDFALVISGNIPLPGEGIAFFDRAAYSASAPVILKLIDSDLRGQPTASLLVRSSTEPAGLNVTLKASGSFGVFTGAVTWAAGPAANDAILQARHGDTLEAVYRDASPAATFVAQARVDLLPPLITRVGTTNRLGKALALWTTDEPARSLVYYGTNLLSLAATNANFDTSHEVVLPGTVAGKTYKFMVVSTDEAGNTSTNDNAGSFFKFVGLPAATVLLVDAYSHSSDDPSEEIPVTSYTDALDTAGVSHEVWNVASGGNPRLIDLLPFKVVMWRINDSFYEGNNTLSSSQQTMIQDYLRQGGAFFLSSMDILTRLGEVPFRTNVLQVAEFIHKPADLFSDCPDCDEDHGAPAIMAKGLESLTRGVDMTLDYSPFPVFELEPIAPNIGPDLSDLFTCSTNAAPILVESATGKTVGIRYPRTGADSPGRVVFLSFPLEAVPMEGPAPNNRAALLKSLMGFLAPGSTGQGLISLDNSSYTVPSRVTVEVTDASKIRRDVTVLFTSTTDPQGVTVALDETARPGVFRGSIVLAAKNQAVGPSVLRAADGDTLTAAYQAGGSASRATAAIDITPPVVTGTKADADFESVTVSWETSEPTDSLVQYGESAFLGRTAYQASFQTSHQLTIIGLQPDHSYFFQVVSRDEAGNTVVDDNGGKLYAFDTLTPLLPPWSDNMESNSEDWTVFNAEGEDPDSGWKLGVPNNGVETQAHSPANAWGSNLDGAMIFSADSSLISPAVELTGGNTATLNFWHNYDFTGQATFETGQLLLFTNSLTQPITLAVYSEVTDGWEQETFDLTPHLGRVVQLVWQYQLLDLEDEPVLHPGWLLDDVSITVSTVFKGTLQITNNLAQATYTVSGPSPFSGSGESYSTNLLAGRYTVSFGDVPYYITPPPQSGDLPRSGKLVFEGKYSFPDANGNRISDLWEQKYFSEISPRRDQQTDSDGDGQTDYAEFVAGTDPTDPQSKFALLPAAILPDGHPQLRWQSTPGRAYRVQSSLDAVHWDPFTAWVRATDATVSQTLQGLNPAAPYLFRIETKP